MAPDDQTIKPGGSGPERPLSRDAATLDSALDASQGVARSATAAGSGGLEKAGDQLGPYKLLSVIGEGGFGTVWLAERREPFVQRVALKVLKAGMDSKGVLARFEQERQALAVMSHPNIAKVLDGGLTPTGRPFFAMEHVKGEPITDYCDRRKLNVKQRLELFTQVCEAVQHAHSKAIIHRDLKPSNILVATDEGSVGLAKVIDFGVAKALSQRMSEHTVFTETGQMIGTPEYMSPEQAEPDANDIDTRSDVYSLGVILYELLSGALPFDPKDLRKRAYREIQRIIREEDPPSPSARLSTLTTKDSELATRIGESRREAVATLARTLRSELEWIPLKAMRKERSERYDSPTELARDVRNYLEGRPLLAAPESTAYRMRKYARRNRGLVTAASAVLAALALGLGVATVQWLRASHERDLAEAERQRVERILVANTYGQAIEAARAGDIKRLDAILKSVRAIDGADRLEGRFAVALSDQSIGVAPKQHEGWVYRAATSPDGRMLASIGGDGSMCRWSLPDLAPIGTPIPAHDPSARASFSTGGGAATAFTGDGRTIVTGGFDGRIRWWDATTGVERRDPIAAHDGGVWSIRCSPDGTTLASVGCDGMLRRWTMDGGTVGEPIEAHPGQEATDLAWSPDNQRIATVGRDGLAHLWDAASGQPLGEPMRCDPSETFSVCFSADGSLIATAGLLGSICLWDAASQRIMGDPISMPGNSTSAIAFVPGTGTVLSAHQDGTIRRWDAATRRAIGEPLRGHGFGWIGSLAIIDGGKALVSAGGDGSIRRWDLSTEDALGVRVAGHAGTIAQACFSPDGRLAATIDRTGLLRFWDPCTASPVGLPSKLEPFVKSSNDQGIESLRFSPDGSRLAVTTGHGIDILLPCADAPAVISIPILSRAMDFSPDGAILWTGSPDGAIHRWDARTGEPAAPPLVGHTGPIRSIAAGPGGRWIASAGSDKTLRIWTIDGSGTRTTLARTFDNPLGHLAVQQSDGVLALIEMTVIHLIDGASGKELVPPLMGHELTPFRSAFSSDGRTLASADPSLRMQLWDVASGQAVGNPTRLWTDTPVSFSFDLASDGHAMLTGDFEGHLKFMHIATGVAWQGAARQRRIDVDRMSELMEPDLKAAGKDADRLRTLAYRIIEDPASNASRRLDGLAALGAWAQTMDYQPLGRTAPAAVRP